MRDHDVEAAVASRTEAMASAREDMRPYTRFARGDTRLYTRFAREDTRPYTR